nr:probable E3 ubiquitin-protein ligase HIP1 [Populus alba]
MGNVSTGLSEDAIVATLKHWKYQAVVDESDSEDEPCCICQEAYADEDDLGKLKCGHDFHFNCIKRWLVEKNNCPICKKAAVDV